MPVRKSAVHLYKRQKAHRHGGIPDNLSLSLSLSFSLSSLSLSLSLALSLSLSLSLSIWDQSPEIFGNWPLWADEKPPTYLLRLAGLLVGVVLEIPRAESWQFSDP